jgi:signal peptidase I
MGEPLEIVAEGEEVRSSAAADDTPPIANGAKNGSPRTHYVRSPHKHQPIGVLPAVQSLLFLLISSLFVMTFTMQPIRIPSASMEPTLLVGDFLLMNKEAAATNPSWLMPQAGIERGDVIVFHDPVDDPSVHLVKRVVGLPGDRIHLRDGVVYVNGVALKEPYAVYRRSAEDVFRDDFPNLNTMSSEVNTNWWIRLRGLVHEGDITVPARSYFVMGDNRNNSEDSRYWGFVPRDYIVGKPLLIYFSFRQPGSDDPADAGLVPGPPEAHGRWDIARWRRMFRVVR